MAENWLPVPKLEGVYEISDQGRVASLPRLRVLKRRIIKGSVEPRGYIQVALSSLGVITKWRVHVLVAAAFIGARPPGAVIRHLDSNPANNNVENLAYGTQAENIADVIRVGHHNHASKTHCLRGHPFDDENTRIREYDGGRLCRICRRAQARDSYARNGKPGRRPVHCPNPEATDG
jgi:hypothetical protein